MSQPAPAFNSPKQSGQYPAAPEPRTQGLAQSRSPVPAEVAQRREMTTSSVLAWWRVVVVLSALAVAVVAPLVLNNNKTSLLRVNVAAQQVLLLQTVRGQLLAAEASASQAMLLAGPGQTGDGQYVDQLATAAQELTRAATMDPLDPDAMASLSHGISVYTVHLSATMATGDTSRMGSANQNLQGTLLPLLDEQISKNLVAMEVATADQRWLSVLLAIPIITIVAASVVVARRTRRLLNVGLLVGLAIAVVIWVNVTQLVTTSAQSVSAVQSSGVSQATSVAQAFAAVTEAKAAQGRVLLGITPTAQGAQTYDEATSRAAQMLAELPQAEPDGMVDQLNQMVATHNTLMAAPSEQRPALLKAAQQPYDALTSWLADQSVQIGDALDQQLSDHARTVENRVGIVAVGMLLVALAAGVGVSQPLRRYR